MAAPLYPVTFVVRVTPGEGGTLSGVIERVRTGEKRRFDSVEALGRLVARMVGKESEGSPSGAGSGVIGRSEGSE